MQTSNQLIKSSWIAAEVTRDRAERVLVVETYIAVSPLEANYDAGKYERVVACVRRVLSENPDIDRASILSMHRGAGCTALFRKDPAPAAA
ncbi:MULTISPECIES: hypothetical protein [Methylobacterium]|uniref:Uncharacterized protein n=1 Tax=Methylobacterium jeotgali TaxID=381630 RepID=A0ABQ4SPQ1_9HYPH|nr:MULTISPECIES: hypothetical protein [Methylobacterium]PIU08326.1 MAG: hypothetical protein COT56_01885 [Methylobacterium sp. CG09_land_8_20_14_0_10_71_15]PIU11610.1 MAG: hypothetical protein COT28_19260 [Methylobacterium sp. CG08_land_8_20_14_0_20_71_15]GBU20038.1 hypothetical protein AwMethylo_42530 [Methylobacterium sp.]GJE05067.1 hypothetical protein AOPFMNJM_0362 [Methylobacterium jeotgali]